jgi:heterodisulfide reductase subunit A-like polyferredoxin
MEGSGPSLRGSPRHVGVLLASQDAVALDATVCQIIGLDPDQVALFQAAARRGWWPMDVAIAGTPIAEVTVPDFRMPESAQSAVRRASRRWIAPWATRALVPYPLPRRNRCTACRTCQRTCPVQAIDIVDRLAVVDYDRCIRCYCCHEMCPEAAIDLRFSLLGRIIRWTGMLGRQTS